jgi:N-acetylmuramoyl-L-alanine amidase
LLLMARLRRLRGAKRRAASTLQTLICDYSDGDMLGRAKEIRKRWGIKGKRCRAAVPKPPPKRLGATAQNHSAATAKKDNLSKGKQANKKSPPGDLGLGAVTASGGDLSASLRRVRRIVIDPGHGGDDPGAIGHGGVHEADLAYTLSVSVADELRSRGYQVLMTRSAKQGRTLRQRTEYANRHQADLFISIHLNAAKRRAYGFEVYYLDVGANRYARRLAARENRQSEEEVDALRYILADLATKGNAADSRGLATSLTQAVDGFRSNRKKEIRSALFSVLLGARMPAVLIEAGFVTDGDDVKRLNSSKRRQATAAFLADGIDAFAKKLAEDRR